MAEPNANQPERKPGSFQEFVESKGRLMDPNRVSHALLKEIAKRVEENKTDPAELQTLCDNLNEYADELAGVMAKRKPTS